MEKKLNVVVNRVLYPPAAKEDAGSWFVLLTSQGKACGSMLWRPEQGERLVLSGKWGAYRGERNFKFTSAMPDVPVNPRDQLMYVCERATGVGPAMADAIWDAKGDDWRNLENGDVSRVKGNVFLAFQEAIATFDTEHEKSQGIAWLMGKGASVSLASLAWDTWGKETVGVIQTNCYRLAELPHYGFTHVDGSIRVAFGVKDGDPRRVKAAILYALGQLTASGSTVTDWPALRNETCRLIGSHHSEMVSELTSEMFQDGSLKGFEGTQSIALGTDYRNERDIWGWVRDAATVCEVAA